MSNKLDGITLHAEGEANCYRLMRGGNWLAAIRMNGELLVWDQEQLLTAMLQGQQAEQVGEPDCDRSACGDFSPGPCDNPDCPALRSNKAAPVAYITGQFAGRCVIEAINRAAVLPTGMALYSHPQPSAGVVMPGRAEVSVRYGYRSMGYAEGWNDCLDEVASLNGKEVGRG